MQVQAQTTSDLARSFKMDKVIFIEVEQNGVMTQHAIIDHGNEQFTSMPKSTYDELKANEAKTI